MHDEAPDTIVVDGRVLPRVPFGEEKQREESPCPGCGAYYFALHELGCDVEECPACGGALARCGCGR
jgi:hypothetical protein